MGILLKWFPAKKKSDVENGAVAWLKLKKAECTLDNEVEPDVIAHFKPFALGSNAKIQEFALWALNVLKNLLSNSFVESLFSTLTMFKSKHRGQLDDDALIVPLVLRTESKFKEVAFEALGTDLAHHRRKKRARASEKKVVLRVQFRPLTPVLGRRATQGGKADKTGACRARAAAATIQRCPVF